MSENLCQYIVVVTLGFPASTVYQGVKAAGASELIMGTKTSPASLEQYRWDT